MMIAASLVLALAAAAPMSPKAVVLAKIAAFDRHDTAGESRHDRQR